MAPRNWKDVKTEVKPDGTKVTTQVDTNSGEIADKYDTPSRPSRWGQGLFGGKDKDKSDK